ncbi:hypothetical protein [Bradyrhizobium sp. BR 10289]|uniref:hypothetical protein n=1 Tax=Bradyrhizobium sp. BR 10289 TaxID=2749993 RepID=UPI001C6498C8|nr:hypothetical protein [Bradyrhizobium sp. BR 10289]MBW7970945.1 hypothetical protein [Bradyrhizobium sp. BR 10289]
MATHTDIAKFVGYSAGSYPSIDGGAQRFITLELQKIQTSIASIAVVLKLLEARMNTNGLT